MTRQEVERLLSDELGAVETLLRSQLTQQLVQWCWADPRRTIRLLRRLDAARRWLVRVLAASEREYQHVLARQQDAVRELKARLAVAEMERTR